MNRFWDKVDKSGDCWEWTAGKTRHGYGSFKLAGRTQYAHRVAYELCVGELQKGQVVMHSCDNPSCVNPDHLIAGTQKDNMRDMVMKGRGSAPGAKLTLAAVRQLLSMGSRSAVELARFFAISTTQVRDIRNRKYWKGAV